MPNIFRAKFVPMRILWVVAYLACVAYSLYLMSNSIRKYLRYETSTSIQYISSLPTDFPAVTICNLNPFNELYSIKHMRTALSNINMSQNCNILKGNKINYTANVIAYGLLGFNDSETLFCNASQYPNTSVEVLNGFQVEWCNKTNQAFARFTPYTQLIDFLNTLGNQGPNLNLNLKLNYAFDIFNWTKPEWLNYMLNSGWANMTLDAWLAEYLVDKSELFNPANNSDDCLKLKSSSEIDILLDIIKRNLANSNLSDFDKYWFGFNLGYDMMKSCDFNNQKCLDDFFKTKNSNFTVSWNNNYGRCSTFNDGTKAPILTTSESGPNRGLKMTLSVGKISFKSFNCRAAQIISRILSDSPTIAKFAYRSGLYLLVHNQSKPMQNLDGGIFVAPGLETYIAISRTFISKQPEPYSNCLASLVPFSNYSRTIFNYFSIFNVTDYDQEFCTHLCHQDKLIKKCNCSSLAITTLNGTRYCENDDEKECEKNFDALFTSSNPEDFCENVCRPQCESQMFDYSTSSSKFPTQDYINSNPTKKPMLRFILNYKDNTYTQVSENPTFTFEMLLAEVGGQIDLFIGISFLSVLEVLELLVEMTVFYLRLKP